MKNVNFEKSLNKLKKLNSLFLKNINRLNTISENVNKTSEDAINILNNFDNCFGYFNEYNAFINMSDNDLSNYIFYYEDIYNEKLDNFLPIYYDELVSFNIYSIAPYMAYKIGVYDNEKRIGYIELRDLKKNFNNRLYRVGLMSDMHYNDTSIDIDPTTIENIDGSEYDTDLENALSFYQNKEEVLFMCSTGDVSTDSKQHLKNFALALKTEAPTTPLYSCLGNHDFQATHYNMEVYDSLTRIGIWNEYITPNDSTIHYYDESTEEGKLSYYIEKDIPNTNKKDIYLFLSVDYGVTHDTKETKGGWDIQGAQKMLDYSNDDVQELMSYVNCNERTENQQQYDYQFYNSNVLLWVKNIIESYPNRRIFLFTHQFFTQKSGNNNSDNYYSYAHEYWRISRKDDNNGQIAYCLCGLQYEFMNKLNNEHKNVIWFTGHSHYSWRWEKINNTINICNKDYEIVDPNDEDFLPGYRYFRKSNEPICDSAYNVHLPSLARPIPIGVYGYSVNLEASEGAIMDIYEDYVDIRGIIFKENDNEYSNKYYPLSQYRINVKSGE